MIHVYVPLFVIRNVGSNLMFLQKEVHCYYTCQCPLVLSSRFPMSTDSTLGFHRRKSLSVHGYLRSSSNLSLTSAGFVMVHVHSLKTGGCILRIFFSYYSMITCSGYSSEAPRS